MGFMTCMGFCVVCGTLFEFNAHLVPSVRVKGHREPLCQTCVEAVNRKRVSLGAEPFRIPPGAYEAE